MKGTHYAQALFYHYWRVYAVKSVPLAFDASVCAGASWVAGFYVAGQWRYEAPSLTCSAYKLCESR